MRSLKPLLLAALTSAACGPVEEPEPIPTFDEAVAEVRQRLHDAAGIDFTAEYKVSERDDLSTESVGRAFVGGGRCFVEVLPLGPEYIAEGDRRLSPLAFKLVLIHEFGHCIGLQHIDDETSVMHPTLVWIDIDHAVAEVAAQVRQ